MGLSATEQRTHFAMWCVVGAPLLAGTDLVHASPETLAILTNKEVIAVNQDPGKGGDAPQGTKRGADANKNELWAKDLADGSSVAVALLNLGSANATIAVDWDVLGLDAAVIYAVRDLHAHKDLGSFSKTTGLSQAVESHGVALLKFTAAGVAPTPAPTPAPSSCPCCEEHVMYDSHDAGNTNLEAQARHEPSALACQGACAAFAGGACVHWTLNTDNGNCWLMSSAKAPKHSAGSVSGPPAC